MIAEMPAPLVKILPSCPGVDEFYREGARLPAFDVHAPLMGLPMRCGTTLSSVPASMPYRIADPSRVDAWRQGPLLN